MHGYRQLRAVEVDELAIRQAAIYPKWRTNQAETVLERRRSGGTSVVFEAHPAPLGAVPRYLASVARLHNLGHLASVLKIN